MVSECSHSCFLPQASSLVSLRRLVWFLWHELLNQIEHYLTYFDVINLQYAVPISRVLTLWCFTTNRMHSIFYPGTAAGRCDLCGSTSYELLFHWFFKLN